MRLEKLRREFVPLAYFRPVILVHWDLRPRFGIEIRVTPDGGDQIRRSDGGLFAESPTVQQFTDVSHATFPPQPQLLASAPLPSAWGPDANRTPCGASELRWSPRLPSLRHPAI